MGQLQGTDIVSTTIGKYPDMFLNDYIWGYYRLGGPRVLYIDIFSFMHTSYIISLASGNSFSIAWVLIEIRMCSGLRGLEFKIFSSSTFIKIYRKISACRHINMFCIPMLMSIVTRHLHMVNVSMRDQSPWMSFLNAKKHDLICHH